MLKSVVGAVAVICSVGLVAYASTEATSSKQDNQNPYAGKYERNLAGMSLPDQTLDGVLGANADVAGSAAAPGVIAQSSKTCSQRCSTTCTTTRGCKRQTDGCNGSARPPSSAPSQPLPPAPLMTPPVAGPVAGAVQLTQDLTALTTVNAQRALVIAGYEGLCVTGTMEPTFDLALKDFQSRHRIAATGVLTLETWQALQPLLARASRQ